MKLSIINGSPRGKSSNTRIILEKFLSGFCSVENNFEFEEAYLKTEKDKQVLLNMFKNSDILIFAFPLYTDAMPGIVKELFERINPSTINKKLKLGFIVQCGFPESHHMDYIKNYLEKLAHRLGVEFIGTAAKGGVEGLKIQPKWMTNKYLDLFYDLGQQLAIDHEFDEAIMDQLSKPKQLSKSRLIGFRLFSKLGLVNFYWNWQLKNNNAYHRRYAKPYNE